MFEFKVTKLTDHITHIVDETGVAFFLVTGSEKAMLIDTGVGLLGIKETVESLTSLPCELLLTHGHGDHVGGAGAFDGAYIMQSDAAEAIEHTRKMRYRYTKLMFGIAEEKGKPHVVVNKDIFVPELTEQYNFKWLTDGQEFDLGGVTLKVIDVAGHTKGTVCVLVKEDRHILFGDACNANTLVAGEDSTTISEYKQRLRALKEYEKDYDVVMYSHGPATGPSALDDNLELCDKILAGTDEKIPELGISGPGYRAAKCTDQVFVRADGKAGNIYYSDLTAK